jgi:hypothetical protein
MTSTSTPVSASMRSTSALLAEPANARDGAIGRRCGDPAVARHVVSEAEHVLLARDRLEGAVGVHVGDEQMEGVRSEVERRDAHAAASVVRHLMRA